MPIRPEDLPPPAAPEVIVDDRACRRCGYNLRGLKTNQKCPECGSPVKAPKEKVRYKDRMSSAPVPWLKTYAIGTACLFWGAFMLGVSTIIWMATGYSNAGIVALIATLIWYPGVWFSTNPRPESASRDMDPRKEWANLRLAARVTQIFVPVAVLCGLVLHSVQSLEVLVIIALAVSTLIAMAGWFPLMIIQSNLAYWASDTELADKLRNCSWCAAVGLTLGTLFLFGAIAGYFGSLLGVILVLLVSTGGVLLPVCYTYVAFFQLWRMAHWVVINHVIEDARDDRLRAKAEAARRNAQSR